MLDPSVTLGSWFWDFHHTIEPRPSVYSQGHSIQSLNVTTMAEIVHHLQDPEPNICQLRCIYDLIKAEKPRVRRLLSAGRAAPCARTQANRAFKNLLLDLFSWATILTLEALINRVLRIFEPVPDPLLWEEAINCYHEALEMVQECNVFRPYGSGFVPDALKAVLASASNIVDDTEMKALLAGYEQDVVGADYIGEYEDLKRRFELMEKLYNQDSSPESTTLRDGKIDSPVLRASLPLLCLEP